MRHAGYALAVLLLASTLAATKPVDPVPVFRQDLRPYGFVVDTNSSRPVGMYFDLAFLDSSELLVSANTRTFANPVEPAVSEGPAKLLLYDVEHAQLCKQSTQTLSQTWGAVRATRGGNFAALDLTGVRICTIDLVCGAVTAAQGPLEKSPDGSRLLVGNGRSGRVILDSASLRELARFPFNASPIAISATSVMIGGKQVSTITNGVAREPFATQEDSDPAFLNDNLFAGLRLMPHDSSELDVRRLDGTTAYEVALKSSWYETKLVPAANGTRFCAQGYGYNRLSLPSILGYGDVPFHWERIQVFDTATGKELFALEWDPRPYNGYPVRPALSPDGHRLAIERRGFLEVYEIP